MAQAYDPRAPGLLTFFDAVARFRDGTDTPAKYLERCLERIAERESSLKAFAAANLDRAMVAAEAAAKRYSAGKPLSAIDGLPIAVKDVFETSDVPTGWGSETLAREAPRGDAAIVRALRAGGAAIVGKTRLPELGFGRPPPTINPWDASRGPGGSSSGSAAAVGAALVPVAIGTQGKGSLTRPASYCGVYGFKPGHGTIHRGGDGGAQATNTHIGTLAGSLEDAWATARFLTVTAGPHPGHFSFAGPAALPEAQKPARLVRLEGSGWDETADAIKAAYEALLEAIETAGVVIESADDTPASRAVAAGLEDAENALMIIADWESVWPYVMHLERDRAAGGNGYDPVTVERGFARADVRREDYEDALRFRIAFREKLAACQMDNAYFISPAATDLAPLLAGGTGSAAYQWASSLAGNPVVALPLMAADGLPAGLQLQGFEGQESALAAACTWLDQAFKRGEI